MQHFYLFQQSIMPPITLTEVLETPIQTKSVKCNLTHNGKFTYADETQKNVSPYDEILSKYREPMFMRPVRRWEKRMGFVTPVRWINTFIITAFHVSSVVWLLVNVYNYNLPKLLTVIFGKFKICESMPILILIGSSTLVSGLKKVCQINRSYARCKQITQSDAGCNRSLSAMFYNSVLRCNQRILLAISKGFYTPFVPAI